MNKKRRKDESASRCLSRWSCHASTIATQHSRTFLHSSIVDLIVIFSMPQPWRYTGHLVTSTLHLYSETFIGCMLGV